MYQNYNNISLYRNINVNLLFTTVIKCFFNILYKIFDAINFKIIISSFFFFGALQLLNAQEKINVDTKKSKDSFKISSSALDAPIFYKAEDSLVLKIPQKKVLLYGKKSQTKYQDYTLNAPGIIVDQETQLVTAHLVKDSLGKVTAFPVFQQADFKTISDSIIFNIKTGKGITKSTYTSQDDMYLYAETIKKDTGKIAYAQNARITTCNLDTPHFAFVTKKVKLINGVLGVTGPIHPEIENVPLPIVLPFSIYPLKQGRRSGFMQPSIGANSNLGLNLEGIGYYKILSPYWDVQVLGNIYSLGSWQLNINPRYIKKYRYSGAFNLGIINTRNGLKRDKDFRTQKSYSLRWSHSMDSKARPGVSFMANVDMGTSNYNSALPNNNALNIKNNLTSSIQYAKQFKWGNLSLSAGHNQTTNTPVLNIALPQGNLNLNNWYPFKNEEQASGKWYESMSIGFNSNIQSKSFFVDTIKAALRQLRKNYEWGLQNSIPLTVSLPQLGPFNVAPSISLSNTIYQNKTKKSWDNINKKVINDTTAGIYSAFDMSYGFGITTRIIGMIAPKKTGSRLIGIRHEIRPTIGLNVKPNINKRNFYVYQSDSTGTIREANIYEDNVYSAFSNSRNARINFGLDNIIQMKTRSKKDTTSEGIKKMTLIDGLSFNTGYNILGDSFKLDNISVGFRTNLFEKINITGGAILSPYVFDTLKQRIIDRLIWSKKALTLGRLTEFNLSLNTSLKGGEGKTKKPTDRLDEVQQRFQMTTDELNAEANYIQRNPAEFVDFSIPWSANIGYSLTLSRNTYIKQKKKFKTQVTQTLNINGDLNITEKWKAGTQAFFDITKKQITNLTFFLSREMHCWQMTINVAPIGLAQYFSFNISPKSGLLRDLRINRTRQFFNGF